MLRDELARQIGRELGEPDGILVFDPSGFPQSGRESVGVARQWCGRLGKTDNCQVAVFLGDVSRHEHALVAMRLYLPAEWTKDAARMKKAGVPKGTTFRTRHELVLEMLAKQGRTLPHQWITGDDELGRPSWFRRDLRASLRSSTAHAAAEHQPASNTTANNACDATNSPATITGNNATNCRHSTSASGKSETVEVTVAGVCSVCVVISPSIFLVPFAPPE